MGWQAVVVAPSPLSLKVRLAAVMIPRVSPVVDPSLVTVVPWMGLLPLWPPARHGPALRTMQLRIDRLVAVMTAASNVELAYRW